MVESPLRIPFHLCDPARILFFGSLYELYHQFLEDHIHELGVPWSQWFQGETGSPVRGLKTSYNHPLDFGQSYRARLSVLKLGNSTVTFLFEVIGEKNKVHARTEVTHCFVDKKNRTKVLVPNTLKQAFLEHLQP